jgi:ketol-acid reductoisomerase
MTIAPPAVTPVLTLPSDQDATGRAKDRCLATGIAIGSGYLFETTFQKEVFSDLTGERGVLMGAIYGLWLAQYEVLRANGHSPSEAFNETVEEATQSLYPLIAENGMDWMYANCSTTAFNAGSSATSA